MISDIFNSIMTCLILSILSMMNIIVEDNTILQISVYYLRRQLKLQGVFFKVLKLSHVILHSTLLFIALITKRPTIHER